MKNLGCVIAAALAMTTFAAFSYADEFAIASQPVTTPASAPATRWASATSTALARRGVLELRAAASQRLEQLISKGMLDEALAVYRREPLAERLTQLGEALKRAGRGLEMLELYHDYLLAPPPSPEGFYHWGYSRLGHAEELTRQLVEVGDGPATAKRLEEKIATIPREVWPHLRLGYVWWLLGERSKALAEFDRYVALGGEPSAGWLGWMADLCRGAGLTDQAIGYYQRALTAPFSDEDVHAASSMSAMMRSPDMIRSQAKAGLLMDLASVYRSAKRWSDAQKCYEQVLTLKPPAFEVAAQMALAEVFKAQGKRNPLIDQLEDQLKADPKNADLHARLGVLLLAASEVQQGIAHYRQAADAMPELLSYRLELADALAGAGSAKEAFAEYAATLTAAARQQQPPGKLGDRNVTPEMVLSRLDRLGERAELRDDLLKLYRSILQMNASTSKWTASEYTLRNVLESMTGILARRADYAGIVDLWLEYRSRQPTIARERIYSYLNRLDSLDGLIARVRESIAKNPADVCGRFILGDALTAAGRTPEALSVYDDLSRSYPKDERIGQDLAATYLKMDQKQRALQQYEGLLKLYPPGSDRYVRMLGLVAGTNLRLGNRSDAAGQFREALKFAPLNETYLKGLRDAGGEAPATASAPTPSPTTNEAAALRIQAGELLAKGRYDEADEAFNRILAGRPTDVEAMVMLAKSYLQAGRKPQAVAAFEHAYEMRRWTTTNYDIRQQLERLYRETDAQDKLLALYVADRDWQSVRDLYRKKPGKYTEFLQDQLHQKPDDTQLRFYLAEDALDRGKQNDARPILEQLESEKAKGASIDAQRLADGFERLDEPAHALKLLDAADYAQRPDPNDWLGTRFMRLYAKTGQMTKMMEICLLRLEKDSNGTRTMQIAQEVADYALASDEGRALLETFLKEPDGHIVPKVARRFAGAVRARLDKAPTSAPAASGPAVKTNPIDLLKHGRVVRTPMQAQTLLDFLDALAASADTAVDQSFRSARPLPAPKLNRKEGPALELLAEALAGLPVAIEFSPEGYWLLYQRGDSSIESSFAASGGAFFTFDNGSLLRKADGRISGMGHLRFDPALKPYVMAVGMFPRVLQAGDNKGRGPASSLTGTKSSFDSSGMVSFSVSGQAASTKSLSTLKMSVDVAVCLQWRMLTSDALNASEPMLLKDPTCTATIGPLETVESAGGKLWKIPVTIQRSGGQKWEPRMEFLTADGKTVAWSGLSGSGSQDKMKYNLSVRADAFVPSATKLVIHLPVKVEVVPVELDFKDVSIIDIKR